MTTDNTQQANNGDWDTDFPTDEQKQERKENAKNFKKTEWMKFGSPGSYTIRLAGKFVKYLRYGDEPFGKGVRVITHPSYKGQDPAWEAGFYPRESFAIHMIDRADGKVKILDKGNSIFKAFAKYKKVNDVNPAGKEGPDFVIDVEWPNGDKRQAKYSVTPKAKPAPFTDAEIELIKANLAPLHEIYKSTELSKINELWAALPSESKKPKPREDKDASKGKTEARVEPKTTPVIEEKMEESPAETDDLFGNENNAGETSF